MRGSSDQPSMAAVVITADNQTRLIKYPPRILWIADGEGFYPYQVVMKRGALLVTIGEWAEAESLFAQNLARIRAAKREELLAEACLKLADILEMRGQTQQAMDLVEEAGEICRSRKDQPGIRKYYSMMAKIYNHLSDYRKSLELLSLELELAQKENEAQEVADILGNMGICYYWLGETAKALEMFEAELSHVKKTDNLRSLGNVYHMIGRVHREDRDYERARPYLEQAQDLFRATGDLRSINMALGSLAGLYYYQGQYHKALEMYDQQLAISQKMGDIYFLACIHGDIAAIHYDSGNFEMSRHHILQGLRYAEHSGDKTSIASSHYLLALLDAEAGDDAAALSHFDQSIAHARQTTSGRFSPEYLAAKAWFCYERGMFRQSEETCREAREEARKHGRQDILEKTQLLSDLLEHPKDPAGVEARLRVRAEELPDQDPGKAELYYWLWRLDRSEKSRGRALELYSRLYAEVPEYSRLKKIKELKSRGPTGSNHQDQTD